MSSFLFLAACGAIGYIAYWSIKNDRIENADQQTGFLRMRSEPHAGDPAAGAHGRRKKWSRSR